MQRRRWVLLVSVGVLALVSPAAASATQAYSDTIRGQEYFFTSTDGRFAGGASGDLAGAWNANVRHTKLCLSCTPTAKITGGSFQVAASVDSIQTLVTGNIAAGSIHVLDRGAGCTNQTFSIRSHLSAVGPSASDGSGTGVLSATLTHHRRSVFGRCVIYDASVKGTLDLSF